MLSARVIPCLDVDAGRVVKGVKFKELKDAGDPVEVATAYQEQGADELVFLDITASSDERQTIRDVVEKTVESCFMPVTVGGGIRQIKDIRDMLLCGADKISLNTAAILNPELINHASNQFGNQCIVIAIDAKWVAEKQAWYVYTHGGRKPTALNAVSWAKEVVERGAGEILLTSMDRDGTKNGYDIPLTRTISDAVEVPVIASGGVGSPDHLAEGVLSARASAVLAASIFHFGEFSIQQTKQTMRDAGVPVRL